MTTTELQKILEDNRDNTDMLRRLVSECNSYDGCLENLEVHEFDEEFFETYFEGKPMEAVRATFFGEINNWTDEWIRFNGYGNLESLSDYQLEGELKDYADEIIENTVRLVDDGNIDIDYIIEDLQ